MTNSISLEQAKEIMGQSIITPDDLLRLNQLAFRPSDNCDFVPFSEKELKEKANDYLLIYGCSKFLNDKDVTIRNFKSFFGDNPANKTPCFYFQDWYNNESFIDDVMEEGWFLIRKHVYEASRRVLPDTLEEEYSFPTAIRCTYSFFVSWLVLNEKLWYHDFVWCKDKDHNGDRIYVGKYNDVDGVNKDGFSIHRHLSLRNCYGCID